MRLTNIHLQRRLDPSIRLVRLTDDSNDLVAHQLLGLVVGSRLTIDLMTGADERLSDGKANEALESRVSFERMDGSG